MVRKTRAEQHESVRQPVISVANEYAAGYEHPAHRHQRSQFLYAEYGTMLVDTDDGRWVVPGHEGLWIPARVRHGMRMLTPVGTRSVYFRETHTGHLPQKCEVLGVSPLLRQLLIAAADLPAAYSADSRAARIMSLIVDEVGAAPVRPLSVPMPRDAKLAERCQRFVEKPAAQDTIGDWCRRLHLSRRSFTRLFRRETGLSFAHWQRRALVQAALARLLSGARVTDVALALGYSSSSAFTTMFASLVGRPPTQFLRR
jgi:AraC-like DNA-binding protein/mannose-6-phosphate isomerase-like protein (cupin superfamily)